MNIAAPARARLPLSEANYPSSDCPPALRKTVSTDGVSEGRHSHSCADLAREVAIQQAGRDIEAAMGRYGDSGNFADRGEADAARLRMQELIAGRSPEQVARMQAAQNERMAREPGAAR